MNKVDLTPIVGSQVLCEFWSYFQPDFGWLSGIDGRGKYIYKSCSKGHIPAKKATYCRIVTKHWISNANGKLVLPDGLKVNIITDDYDADGVLEGYTHENCAVLGSFHIQGADEIFHLSEYKCNASGDVDNHEIIAVQVTGLADGWEW